MRDELIYNGNMEDTGIIVLTREQMMHLCSIFAVARNTYSDRAIKYHKDNLHESPFMEEYHKATSFYYEVIEPQWFDTLEEKQ